MSQRLWLAATNSDLFGAIASAAEVEIDTLAERLQEDALANERVFFMPRLVGAWVRVGEAA